MRLEDGQSPGGVPERAGATGAYAPKSTGGLLADPPEITVVERRLSVERVAPYRAAVGGDLAAALRLYEWNREVASAFGATLGDVEVLLRNAMHERLTEWSAARFGEPRWYLDPSNVLTITAVGDVLSARRRATADGRAETPGRVVAELNLGFWRYLLASRYERVLWLPCLRDAFPGLRGRGLRKDLNARVAGLHFLRNRIAHHEPVHNRPLGQLWKDAMQVAEWICPVSRQWIARRCRVSGLLDERPIART